MMDDSEAGGTATLFRDVGALLTRLQREAAEAATLCDKVLNGPPAWWGPRLRPGRRTPTTSLVQHLLKRMRAVIASSPETAQAITTLAVELSAEIDADVYPRVHVEIVQGQALRDHAYVLSFRGLDAEALEFAERASRLFARSPAASYDAARLALVKASIFRRTGRAKEALALTQHAAATFLGFGDRCRYVDARIWEGMIVWNTGAIERALEIWTSLENDPGLDDVGAVRVAHNIALALSDLGRHAAAIPYLDRCAKEFELLGMRTECTRSRAVLGRSLVGAGKAREAIPILRLATHEFESLGMIFDAGLVALEHVEALLVADQPEEVHTICHQAIAYFNRTGAFTYAATALAYLREASALTPATPRLVRDAHASLRRLATERPSLVAPGTGEP